ncbi:Cytochrome P450 [Quillaja saponaria]|uniref:Cytochrome P450 n=1 Tax=Quillaja saponaria TaxID=32244 RepID=A0AAD7LMQ5_QUISA|nr:Cytochrome P450 [Quillaja saponaria]
MNIFITSLLFLIPVFFILSRTIKSSKRIPPGSLGMPVIGQSLSFLRAMRANTAEKWLQERIRKYGPVSKLSLFGKPTVFIYGQTANKFLLSSNNSTLVNQQAESSRMILGERNLLELHGADHKRVREALVSFLKPESLKQYVGKMDEEIRKHLEMYWQGKQEVTVLPVMKILTFNMICSLLFGLEEGTRREKFLACFKEMMKGIMAVPINLPFTRYNRSLRQSARVQDMVKELVHERRVQLEQKAWLPDMTLHLLTITFIIRQLANEPAVCEAVLQEQQEIAKSKNSGETLTWADLAKMKYTWRVAMETLRMFPPVFGSFRKGLTDTEYNGYLIPKGWQIFWAIPMTHMDSSIFPEPSKFNPSRFENQASVPPYSFIPFGGGPRMCPGYEFARTEILIAIHYLVTRYKWKLCADNSFSWDPMPEPSQGLPIKVWPRELS